MLGTLLIAADGHRVWADDDYEIWSLGPVQRYPLPEVERGDWCRTPIDRFILAELEVQGLKPAEPLSRARLIRRAYFDLWGLPPSPEEVRAFVEDPSDDAYERLLDRLLASPHYAERWARYWLDLVRFADTNGYERDAEKPFAWKYRDWVIASLDEDKPYDRFLTEQLAGDELPDADEQTRIATGFYRVGTFDDEPNDPLLYKYEQLDDLLHTTCTSMLAITLKCARCHDHKFDPIPQTDYYAFLNFFHGSKPLEGELLGFTDAAPHVAPIKLLEKGDPHREADEVPAAFLSMLPRLKRAVEPPPEGSPTTRRRLQLAAWITSPDNPLTARVWVNRVWQHHFGAGLVRTPNNFGVMSEEPTHPKLLDHLAAEFVEGGWKLKPLHRQIMLSSVYRQDSTHADHETRAQQDPGNHLWWRTNRRRLEAEPIRDSMLAVSGQLNPKMGGPGFVAALSPEALEGLSRKGDSWKVSPVEEQHRRSVYMYSKRALLTPLMTVFDFSDTTQPCGQRSVTTVAPQALALLNNHFVYERSQAFARRIIREVGDDASKQVDRAWWLALGRAPSNEERELALAHLSRQTQAFAESDSVAASQSVDDAARPAAEGETSSAAAKEANDAATEAGNVATEAGTPSASEAADEADAETSDAAKTDANAGSPAEGSTAQIGESPRPEGTPRRLALESLCHVLLNSNEFLVID
jgi:hypothetical protein